MIMLHELLESGLSPEPDFIVELTSALKLVTVTLHQFIYKNRNMGLVSYKDFYQKKN